jgi:hypothetical protein
MNGEPFNWTEFLSGKLGLIGIIYGSVVFAAMVALFLAYGAPWESRHDAEVQARVFESEIQSLTAAQAVTQKQLNELTVHEAQFEEHVNEMQKELDRLQRR